MLLPDTAWSRSSHILHGVDFDVARGEVVTLLGRNGAGKTTTLKSIMGPVRRGARATIVFRASGTIRLGVAGSRGGESPGTRRSHALPRASTSTIT